MLKEFRAGEKIRHIALVKVQKIGPTSNGGVFARGIVQDNTATLNFICFEVSLIEKLRKFDGFVPQLLTGQMDVNKFANDGSLQIVLHKLEDILDTDDTTHLVPNAAIDLDHYKAALKSYVENIRNPFLKKLLRSVFSATYDQYIINPAGSKLHHAYIGGLLEHCIDVTDMAVAMAKTAKNINPDLIVVGALLHDIGKVEEISSEYGFNYTTKGRLLGHISISAMLVNSHAERIPAEERDESLLQELLHILLAHHGEHEKGSPIACVTKEAFIVHYADELNSVLNQFDTAQDDALWQFNKLTGRNLYCPVDK